MSWILRSLLVVSVYLLVSAPSSAQSFLAQYSDEEGTFDSPTLLASLSTWHPLVGEHLWENSFSYGEAMPANGTTFAADPQTVAAMGACLVKSDCQVHFVTGSLARSGDKYFTPDDFWTWINYSYVNQKLNTFVPQLGPGFSGYNVTSITRTIDNANLRFEGDAFHGYYYGNIKQTVNFYGVAVPEPATLSLIGYAMVVGVGVLRRR